MSSESKPTLYERLGGVYSIAAVVDDFIDRVMHNPVLNANAAVDEMLGLTVPDRLVVAADEVIE